MTKMDMIERFYGRNEELERKFDAAEKAGDAKNMDACQDAYQDPLQEVRAEGEAFGDMMRLYKARKQPAGPFRDMPGTGKDPQNLPGIWGDRVYFFLQLVQRHPGSLGIYPDGLHFERNDRDLRVRPETHEQRIRESPRLPLQPLRSGDNWKWGCCTYGAIIP